MSTLGTRVARRVAMSIGIGRQTADTIETGGTQTAQVTFPGGELRDGTSILGSYGLCVRPIAGADHAVLFLTGDRTRGVSVGCGDQRYRPKTLQPGEVALYDRTGSLLTLKADGSIAIAPSNGKVTIEGMLTVTGDVVANGVSVDQHVHSGVAAGSADTGAPVT